MTNFGFGANSRSWRNASEKKDELAIVRRACWIDGRGYATGERVAVSRTGLDEGISLGWLEPIPTDVLGADA